MDLMWIKLWIWSAKRNSNIKMAKVEIELS